MFKWDFQAETSHDGLSLSILQNSLLSSSHATILWSLHAAVSLPTESEGLNKLLFPDHP